MSRNSSSPLNGKCIAGHSVTTESVQDTTSHQQPVNQHNAIAFMTLLSPNIGYACSP